MNNLDWRKGKSPVNFCAIYVMQIQPAKTWDTFEMIHDYNVRIGISIKIDSKNKKMISKINIFDNKKEYANWLKTIPDSSNFLSLDLNTEDQSEKLILACDYDQIIEKNPTYVKKRNVGLLVSTMQKLIRQTNHI